MYLKKSITFILVVYLQEYYKWTYKFSTPPFENPGYEPGNDGATD